MQYVDSSIRGASQHKLVWLYQNRKLLEKNAEQVSTKKTTFAQAALASMLVVFQHLATIRSDDHVLNAKTRHIRHPKRLVKQSWITVCTCLQLHVHLPASNQVVEPQRGSVSNPRVSNLGKLILHQVVVCLPGCNGVFDKSELVRMPHSSFPLLMFLLFTTRAALDSSVLQSPEKP